MRSETAVAPARPASVSVLRGTLSYIVFTVVLLKVFGQPLSPGFLAGGALLAAAKLFVELRYPQQLPKFFIATGAALFLFMLSALLGGVPAGDRVLVLLGGSLGLMLVLLGSFQWWSARSRP